MRGKLNLFFDFVSSIGIYQGLINATLGVAIIELILIPVNYPLKLIMGNYANKIWISKFRKIFLKFLCSLIFVGGQVHVKTICEEDIQSNLPVTYFFTHSSNLDPFLLRNYFLFK